MRSAAALLALLLGGCVTTPDHGGPFLWIVLGVFAFAILVGVLADRRARRVGRAPVTTHRPVLLEGPRSPCCAWCGSPNGKGRSCDGCGAPVWVPTGDARVRPEHRGMIAPPSPPRPPPVPSMRSLR